LRLVGEGDVPARKIWRLKMIESTEMIGFTMRLPGLNGALRIWSAARALLALLGLAVVLAAALPAPREALVRQLAAWAESWDEEAASVPAIAAGTIQPGAASHAVREQRAVAEFISKRYRVAQDATAGFVATAYRVGGEWKVDPLLLLAVMAVESRYNPVAESNMGAKGLMQVIPKFHADKLAEHGGESALLDPHVNIQVGAQILREYLRRVGETETALQMYAGAIDEPTSGYAFKVLAERARLEQMIKQLRRAASA
jgi:soluble lytic murein transglycosylase-like protein